MEALDNSLSQMSSPGTSQYPSSLAQTITSDNEKNIANASREQCNLPMSTHSNNDDKYRHSSRGVGSSSSSSDPSASSITPPENTSSGSATGHVPRTKCHNCRTLGLGCGGVPEYRDAKCKRCLLMGMNCDLEIRNPRSRCLYCNRAMAAKCVGNGDGDEEACESCLRYGKEQSCKSWVPTLDSESNFPCVTDAVSRSLEQDSVLKSLDDGQGAKGCGERMNYLASGQFLGDPLKQSLTACAMGCGKKLMSKGEVICRRCRRGVKESRRETPGRKGATNAFKDGKTLNTCAGCFELNLDPDATEIYCNGCKDKLLRGVAKEKNSRREEYSSWRTTRLVVEDPKASLINDTLDSSTTSNTNTPSNAILLQSRLSTTPNSHRNPQDCQSQAGYMADEDTSDWSGEPYPVPASINSFPTKWAFQPCINCQTSSLLCDHSLPCCTQCKNTDKKCSYRYLTNPGRTKPIRFNGVQRTCFGCFQPNTRIQISGLCQPCEDLRTKSAKNTSTSASNKTGTSSSSQIEESKSELPRFLASLNTRLEDIRLQHCSQQPHTQAMPKPQMKPALATEPVQQSLIPLPPVISSENIALPGFTTPCLACLDKLISCALHPKPSPHLRSSIEPYTPLSIRSTPSNPQDPAAAIPCLACFDGETICAHHSTTDKGAKIALACGSCRLAGLQCDELKPGCGGCRERGVECLYIKGSVEGVEGDAPETLLPLPDSSTETPSIPRACGGCRIAEVACDETRPGCMVCKEKGLECMYITGGIPPFHEPTVLTSIPEDEDDRSQVTHNTRLTNSIILHPLSEEVGGDSMTDVRESQLDDSVILAAESEEDDYEGEDVNAADEGVAQIEDLEGEDCEDWDVVSSNEEYEVIDSGSGRESDDGDSVVL